MAPTMGVLQPTGPDYTLTKHEPVNAYDACYTCYAKSRQASEISLVRLNPRSLVVCLGLN